MKLLLISLLPLVFYFIDDIKIILFILFLTNLLFLYSLEDKLKNLKKIDNCNVKHKIY